MFLVNGRSSHLCHDLGGAYVVFLPKFGRGFFQERKKCWPAILALHSKLLQVLACRLGQIFSRNHGYTDVQYDGGVFCTTAGHNARQTHRWQGTVLVRVRHLRHPSFDRHVQ